jgi:hypothetical protein
MLGWYNMIIEIIVLLGFLGSLVGFIFFVKHYFKTWKEKSDNKKMLLTIETAEDEDACYDKFYRNILDNVDIPRIIMFFFIVGIIAFIFWVFAAPNNPSLTSSTGNEGVQEEVNTSALNDSIMNVFPSFLKDTDGKIPFWVFAVIGGIMFWVVIRQFNRHSFI